MTVTIEYEAEERLEVPYEEIIRNVVEEALDYVECPYDAEVNVVLTDNEGIHQINLDMRGIDRPTDVLSFPMCDFETPGDFDGLEETPEEYFNPDTGELMLGDIVISVEKVKEQAEKFGHSETRELAFLVAHSMLHLSGYDHMEDEERLDMEEKQEEPENLTVVIVKKGDSLAGLVVDNLIGQQEIVIKSLGKYINNNKIISGATILGDGEVALILDVNTWRRRIWRKI